MVSMTMMLAIGSLAVDWGRVQMAKTEMHRAVDAAARGASVYLPGDTTGARAAAISIAAQNYVDGSPLVLQSGDVEFGKWNSTTGVFDTASSTPDAIRITARRTLARGTAIDLPMARALGRSTQDLTFQQVTSYAGNLTGIIGLSSIYADDDFFAASYSSSTTTSPSTSSYRSNSILGSNGNVRSEYDGDLYGTLVLGPSGSRSRLDVNGSTSNQSGNLTASSSPSWSPAANPGGISQTYTVNSNVTLAGGTYYFTSLVINDDLSFSGAATIYVNGNVTFSDYADLRAFGNVPANLKIYVIGSRTFGGTYANNVDIVADVHAPASDVIFRDTFRFYGRLIADTITVDDSSEFYYDESFGTSAGSSGTVTTVK